jgi:hypothetical protein
MRDYMKIEAWRLADDLAVRVYEITRSFPKVERYGLTSQLRRASYSVPANIAEGSSRESKRDYLHFLYITSPEDPCPKRNTSFTLPSAWATYLANRPTSSRMRSSSPSAVSTASFEQSKGKAANVHRRTTGLQDDKTTGRQDYRTTRLWDDKTTDYKSRSPVVLWSRSLVVL